MNKRKEHEYLNNPNGKKRSTINAEPETLENEIGECYSFLLQFPFIFNIVFINGRINTFILVDYVNKVYEGLRLLRPDILRPIVDITLHKSTSLTSVTEACRILHMLHQQFPCMFKLR
jgi:hypothetical protein